jgi:two-component system chemotaxis response regulator CheB
MPVMDGLSAVSEIMSTRPRPILIVSDITDAANAMEAVSRGAWMRSPSPASTTALPTSPGCGCSPACP